MKLSEFFPIWDSLTSEQKNRLESSLQEHRVDAKTVLHSGKEDCAGLILVRTGQLRAFMVSEDGREITLYRLLEGDICLLSASCMLHSIRVEVSLSAERETEYASIPASVYQGLMNESAALANFTNELMGDRFSSVMWLMEQILWKSYDKRLAAFLLEESSLQESDRLRITHEAVGSHTGNPREVVTRMLKYFQEEGMVKLSRGMIELIDKKKIAALAEQ